jgi:hypothetical protein
VVSKVDDREVGRSFRCDDCGAEPGQQCMLLPPTNKPFYQIARYSERLQDWMTHTIRWDPPRLMIDQIEELVRRTPRNESWNDEAEYVLSQVPEAYRRVGKPTLFLHSARIRALSEWRKMNDRLAMQEYLREWLVEFGSIFKEDK